MAQLVAEAFEQLANQLILIWRQHQSLSVFPKKPQSTFPPQISSPYSSPCATLLTVTNLSITKNAYLLKPGMSQKDPKPAETTQNYKTGKIYNFLLDIDFQIWNPNAQIWAFSAKKF